MAMMNSSYSNKQKLSEEQ